MPSRSQAALGRALSEGKPLALGEKTNPGRQVDQRDSKFWRGRTVPAAAVATALRAGHDVMIDGAYLIGDIDLSRVRAATKMLSITRSVISGRLQLDAATIADLDLHDSTLLRGLSAIGMNCRAINLRGVLAEDAVLMRYLSVNGPMEMHDAVVRSTLPEALDIRGASVQRSVRMDRVQVNGAVLASGIEVNGSLNFAGSKLVGAHWPVGTKDPYGEVRNRAGSDRVALTLDGAKVRGGLVLQSEVDGERFLALGLVRAVGGAFDSVNLDGGSFINYRGYSILLERCTVAGNVAFRRQAHSAGTIRLFACTIGDSLEMDSSTLEGPDGFCLTAERTEIKGPVHLRNGLSAHGAVTFMGAQIGGSVDLANSLFRCADVDARDSSFGGRRAGDTAISFENARIAGSLFIGGSFAAEGNVVLRLANVGGNFIVSGSEERKVSFSNIGRSALDAFGLTVALAIVVRHLDVVGVINLRSARCAVLEDDLTAWPEARIGGTTLRRRLTGKPKFVASGLALDGLTYDRLFSDDFAWHHRRRLLRGSLDRRTAQPYLHLARLYAREGFPRDAKRAHIARLNATTTARNPSRWVARPLVGYGYAPLRGLVVLILAAVLGGFYFAHAAPSGAIKPTRPPSGRAVTSNSCNADIYPCFNPYVYSVDSLLPIVGLKQRDHWAPDFETSRLTAAVTWGLSALGWIIGLLVVAGFTSLLRKD
ncbi:hypothetical protein JIG36_18310 [Actinoplanes sp. LDG1-06]|uniref:Membrane-associated oxidoreductase n=1 Tax=Paractinoplanes ovalisporus TaxID=2810368 RepID=A0ABS2ADQ8_9ACTN|nr:hypothetical protein [Actinoplanes ovalisporus]MBM2617513.1 hypothetical protein [Actinoplanes ovalisporus]